jgi:branched-chain amino acid transport system ATP-binding protein
LSVNEGEFVTLLGPNAAGKTSTLRAISQLVPWQGQISFDGHSLRGVAPDLVARRGLIHVPEGRRVFPTLSVRENLQVGLHARGKRAAVAMDEIFDLFPQLKDLSSRQGWALSGGEQQMVAIGRALIARPRLLLLDEPSLGLAPLVASTVFVALGEIATRTAVLVVEQNTSLALSSCSRGYVLVRGRILLSGNSEELQDRKAMVDAYLGERDEYIDGKAPPGNR